MENRILIYQGKEKKEKKKKSLLQIQLSNEAGKFQSTYTEKQN